MRQFPNARELTVEDGEFETAATELLRGYVFHAVLAIQEQLLRELGVRIALDDFGTGHSSLSYLRRFPIDRVKIDREFISEIDKSRSNRAIVAAIVTMAHGLDLFVTAEGVETEEQVEFLREQKCEEVQGFLYGRPAPPA